MEHGWRQIVAILGLYCRIDPIMMSMSGVDMEKLIAVNGCRNKCCDRIMEKNGMKSKVRS